MSMKPGDWKCQSCQHLNFKSRELCQRCSQPRTTDVRPGDWYCLTSNCGALNFASRSSCFKCKASMDDSGSQARGSDPIWRFGDWMCTRLGCNEHNFKNRTECYRCNAPRGSST